MLLTGTEAGLVEDLGADFLYIDVGFFPVPKKAAPTKILGLGFRLLKEMVMAFLDSACLVLLLVGDVVVADGGLAATLHNAIKKKLIIIKTTQMIKNANTYNVQQT